MLRELVYDYILHDSPAAQQFDVHTNIKAGMHIGFVDGLSKIGQKSRGCSPATDTATASFTDKRWNPKAWDFRLSQCWAELQQSIIDYGLNAGATAPNFIGTPIGDLIENLIRDAMAKMFLRFGWFGDTNASTIAAGGNIAKSADLIYYNVVDGVFKQIEQMITENKVNSIDIAANAKETTAEQLAEKVDAINIFTQLIINQTPKMAALPIADKRLRASGLLVNKLKEQLLSEGINTSEQFYQRENGIEGVKFLGYEIEAMHFWDEIIQSDMTTTKMDRPYRAILTAKDNLKMGLDGDESNMDEINVWYENKERRVYMESLGALDIMVVRPELVAVAGL